MYPEECCGLLLGRSSDNGNEIIAIRRATNRNVDRRHDRFVIGPDDFIAADRAARKEGLDIVGMYHSHPDHPARPSSTDHAQATFPGYTYVIVAVVSGRATDLTAWTLAADRSRFVTEAVREGMTRES
jgi:proteasome lid subunit RPN8/RPN11